MYIEKVMKKIIFLRLRCLDFCVFDESTNQIFDVVMDITAY